MDIDSFDPWRSERPLIVYLDIKSPYAFIAKDPTYRMAEELGIQIDWRPLTLNIPSYLGSAKLAQPAGGGPRIALLPASPDPIFGGGALSYRDSALQCVSGCGEGDRRRTQRSRSRQLVSRSERSSP